MYEEPDWNLQQKLFAKKFIAFTILYIWWLKDVNH